MTLAPLRILLIDDYELMRLEVKDTLEDQGYLVSTAESMVHGLQLAFQVCSDLLICGHNPPFLDGMIFLQKFREATTASIPFLLISSHANYDRDFLYKPDGFLCKPFTPKQLVWQINHLCIPIYR